MKDYDKVSRYKRIIGQLDELIPKTDNLISRFATTCALLHYKIPYFFWTGFYLLQNEKLLVGPYQGPLACQELEKNKGVCWNAINNRKTVIVPDVHKFPGHIACDSRSNSEIAVPIFNKNQYIIGVLDIDSKSLNSFDEIDMENLEKIISLLEKDTV
ncbi:GAF domain-containing protein [Bacteroidota bacterium]